MADSAQTAVQENTDTTAQGNDQAAPASLLTGQPAAAAPQQDPAATTPEAGKTDDAPKDGDKPADEAKDDKPAPKAPESYELKAPEGFEKLDQALVDEFTPLARELDLTNDQANKLVETMMPKVAQQLAQTQQAAWTAQLETWVTDVKADKEVGGEALQGSLQAAQRAMTKFASPELKALLEYPSADNPKGMGLGNHPELVRVFARIGKAMADDSFVNSSTNASGQGKSAAEILYGK
jgi:hypothetical protein